MSENLAKYYVRNCSFGALSSILLNMKLLYTMKLLNQIIIVTAYNYVVL